MYLQDALKPTGKARLVAWPTTHYVEYFAGRLFLAKTDASLKFTMIL